MNNQLSLLNPVKKATLAAGCSSHLLHPVKDARVALLAGFVVKYRRVSNKDYEKWISK